LVRADEQRLRQILINLLGNAVKFTTQGEVRLRVRHQREMARIDIVDTGPGMSAEELARVFEPFARGSAAGSASAGGTGLGLTISKMLTELMGGEMTVTSTPGQGSTFSLRLFLPEQSGSAAAMPVPRTAPRRGYAGERRCILVVDNEEADRRLLCDQLQPIGFRIEQAGSGEQCLERLATLQPDAIFMDLAMPGIDGWETLRQIRRRGLSTAPVAIVSANAFDKGLDNDLGLPPEDFLVKPVRLATVLDWLGRRLQVAWLEENGTDAVDFCMPAAGRAPAAAAAAAAVPDCEPPPDLASLQALQAQLNLGYLRGVRQLLDQMVVEQPLTSARLARWRQLAREFRLDALQHELNRSFDEHPAA
jgi:CheY-like chemotaxis protein